MNRPIYLDAHSTTVLDPRVFDVMKPFFLEHYGNASKGLHVFNWKAEAALDLAREQLANSIGAQPAEIIFTSGATESNHLALLGMAEHLKKMGRKTILSIAIEHSSVLGALQLLEAQGFQIQWVPIEHDGRVNLTALKLMLNSEVGLVTIAMANHEIGTIQDIAAIGELCEQHGIYFHTDAAQAVGRISIQLNTLAVDLMTLSAHKVHGPKGVGALYFKKNKKKAFELKAIFKGGNQENKLRPGTANVPLIVGMAKAIEIAVQSMSVEQQQIEELRNLLWKSLQAELPNLIRNGSVEHALPNNLNVSIPDIDGAALFGSIKGVAVSNASSCLNGVQDYSQVLTELGVAKSLAKSSIRFGVSRFNTKDDIEVASKEIIEVVKRLKELECTFFKPTTKQTQFKTGEKHD